MKNPLQLLLEWINGPSIAYALIAFFSAASVFSLGYALYRK